jgi:hypothetical protein
MESMRGEPTAWRSAARSGSGGRRRRKAGSARVFGCTMNTLGCGGARVAGGDRRTLTAGHHFVENCTVFDISRLKRTYTPAVHLDGCGNRIAHNLFEKMPSSALRIEGNDHLIELNLIRHVVQESDDQGGLDMFGNPLYRGVVIRWNRWSDIRGGTHNGAAGVRLDDMISGVAVHGNIFEPLRHRPLRRVQIHGGKENLVDGNLLSIVRRDQFHPLGPAAGSKPSNDFSSRQARSVCEPLPRWPASKRRRMNFISRTLHPLSERLPADGAWSRRRSTPRQRSPWICRLGRRMGLGGTIRVSNPCSSSRFRWSRWDPITSWRVVRRGPRCQTESPGLHESNP